MDIMTFGRQSCRSFLAIAAGRDPLTLIKTVIAPGPKARLLGVRGWYSTNILGNRDGEVLDDPESFSADSFPVEGSRTQGTIWPRLALIPACVQPTAALPLIAPAFSSGLL
jgi:hypothetical protein